jgi:hypothetical protein
MLAMVASVALWAAAGACSGGQDWVAICNRTCDKVAECSMGGVTSATCREQSDCAHTSDRGCKNAQQLVDCINMCNAGACDTFLMCQAACPLCQAQ